MEWRELAFPKGNNWEAPDGRLISLKKNDFLNDLNAAWEYVWPELMKIANKKYKNNHSWRIDFLKELLLRAYESENPALYLCERFMELKGGE